MAIKCLECIYESGSPLNLPFHYKLEHNDKSSKCVSGSKLLSGVCISIAYSNISGLLQNVLVLTLTLTPLLTLALLLIQIQMLCLFLFKIQIQSA